MTNGGKSHLDQIDIAILGVGPDSSARLDN
jgi:hypothetical protein